MLQTFKVHAQHSYRGIVCFNPLVPKLQFQKEGQGTADSLY